MPTYDYECESCGKSFELFQSISEAPKTKCPQCGRQKLKRLIGAGAGFLFKGSGFYITDYRSTDYKAKAKADTSGSSGSPSPASSSSSSSGSSSGGSKSPSGSKAKSTA
jgi:putative FmdB family regulatory protein